MKLSKSKVVFLLLAAGYAFYLWRAHYPCLFVPRDIAADEYYEGRRILRAKLSPAFAEAAPWHRKSAERGFVLAQSELGDWLLKGKPGLDKNADEALKWLHRAAAQNDFDAIILLGHAYYEGSEVTQNYEEALFWLNLELRRRARAGDDFSQNFQDVKRLAGISAEKLGPKKSAEIIERSRNWKPIVEPTTNNVFYFSECQYRQSFSAHKELQ